MRRFHLMFVSALAAATLDRYIVGPVWFETLCALALALAAFVLLRMHRRAVEQAQISRLADRCLPSVLQRNPQDADVAPDHRSVSQLPVKG